MIKLSAFLLLAVVAAGCAAVAVRPLDASHPASPQAPEGTIPELRSLATPPAAAAPGAPLAHGDDHAH